MATKIQIPASGNAPSVRVRKGQQCFWGANGKRTYEVHLPPNAFVEFLSGGTIEAVEGGDTRQVTLRPECTPGDTIRVTFTQKTIRTATAAATLAAVEMDTSATSSGQSDIIVDP